MSLGTKIRKGGFYLFIFKYFQVFMQIFITAVLARMLTPAEFGIVTLVLVFVNFFNLLSDSGLSIAVIQRIEFTDFDFFSLFMITFIYGIFLSLLFSIFGNFIAYFYNNREYIKICYFLSLSLFFSTLNTIPSSLLIRNQNYKAVGFINISVNLISGLTAVLFAYNGFSYYSLIYSSVLSSTLFFLINLKYSELKFFKHFRLSVLNDIFSYSIYQLLFNILNFFTRNFDNIMIGKYLGATELGYYDRAYRLMLFPVGNIYHVISPVLHPVLAEHQNQPDVIYDIYIKIIKLLSLLGFPISVFLFFSAKEIILLLYGKQWLATIPAFKYLSLSIGFQIVIISSGAIFQALDKTKYLFFTGFFSSIISVSGILIGVFVGKSFVSVSFFIFIIYSINFFIGFFLLFKKCFNKNLQLFLNLIGTSIKISIIIFLLNLVLQIIWSIDSFLISLLLKATIFIFSYISLLIFFDELNFVKSSLDPKKFKGLNN